jgi:hypothetical protein
MNDATETFEDRHARHKANFEKVQPEGNWKLPIDKVLPTLINEERKAISEAVIYFCGCVPSFTDFENGTTRVTAIGYYKAVGA